MRNNTEPAPNHNDGRQELIRFLDKLWRYSSPQAWCYAIVHITEDNTSFRHFCIDEFNGFDPLLEAVADYVERNKHNWRRWKTHVYFQVLPMSRKPQAGRGSASDVYVAKVLFADFDFKFPLKQKPEETGCHEKQDHELECVYGEGGKWYYIKRPSLTEFLKQVREIAEPSLVVDSGAGYHVYYLLNEEINVDVFRKLQARLVERLGADPHAKDPARILRLPGTVNPRVKRECRLIYDSAKTYSSEELKRILEAQPGRKLTEVLPPAPVDSKDQLRKLSDEEVKKIVELLKAAYVEGSRQSLSLYLAGWAAKSRINPASVAQIITKLHESTGDEDPLEKRLQAITYSYPKAGIDISQHLDDIEKVTGIRPRLPDPHEQIEVKGKAGVQEILERVLKDENEVLTIMHQLTELIGSPSPWMGDAVFAPMDEARKIYAVIDYSRLRMGIVRLTGTDGAKKLELSPIISEVAPVRIIIYRNALDHTETFELWLDGPGLKDRDPPLIIGPLEADKIAAELKRKALLQVSEDLFLHAFSALLTRLLQLNRVEVNVINSSFSGIFLFEDKITLSKHELSEINKEKLKEAFQLLDELAGKYNKKKFATIIKWGAAAPFNYLRKQLDLWNRWMFLHGNSATGKTTLGKIVLHMWGLKTSMSKGGFADTHEITGSAINTPARIGYHLSATTFPKLVNEAEDVFFNPSVVAIIKGAIDGDVVRGIMDKGAYREYPSRSILILTSNKPFTKQIDYETAEPLSRKMIVITFSSAEKFSEEQQKEFNEKIKPRLPELKEIGNCILNVAIQAGPDFFRRTISEIQLGKELLLKCYEAAGLQPPSWLEEEYHSSESALEEIYIVEQFRNRAKLEILKWYYSHYSKSHPSEDKPVMEKLRKAIIDGLVKGIAFIPRRFNTDRYDQELPVEGDVIIMREFLNQLELDVELSSLAYEIGWPYERVYIPRGAKKDGKTVGKDSSYGQMRAIRVGLNDFIDFLMAAPLSEEDITVIKMRQAEEASSPHEIK